MPKAICQTCGAVIRYRSTKGSSMPRTCACGGPLALGRRVYRIDERGILAFAGYEPARQPDAPKRSRVICAVCGDARMFPSRSVRMISVESIVSSSGWEDIMRIPAGSFVCWHHYQDIFPVQEIP